MKGSILDVVQRLHKGLPAQWFPAQAQNTDGSVPRIWSTKVALASAFAPIWTMLQYVALQTRTSTSSDGWLDLRSWDFFGGKLPRLPGETDAAFYARIQWLLLQPANTRTAISDAIQHITGTKPRIILPWVPTDVGVLDGPGAYGLFMDCDTMGSPARFVDPGLRDQFWIETVLPVEQVLGGTAVPAYDVGFLDTYTATLIDLNPSQSTNVAAIYNLITRLKAAGIVAWVKFVQSVN